MLNPWRKLCKEGPYILEEDRDTVSYYNEKAKGNYKIIEDVMPVPFVGSVLDSEIVILMSNPKYNDTTRELENNEYKEKLIKIFNHECVEYPFFCLDPDIQVGKDYWISKLKGLLFFYKNSTHTSNKASNIILPPYTTREFKPLKDLPSQKYSAYLVKKAIERKAFIIVARGKRYWLQLVPELNNYNYFTLNSWRSPSISIKNCPDLFEKLNPIK